MLSTYVNYIKKNLRNFQVCNLCRLNTAFELDIFLLKLLSNKFKPFSRLKKLYLLRDRSSSLTKSYYDLNL